MRILLILSFLIAWIPGVEAQDELFDRIVSPSESQERLPIGPLFAAFREVARGRQTLASVQAQFAMTTDEIVSLNGLVSIFNSCSSAEAKTEFLSVFEDAMMLAEYGKPDWYNTAPAALARLQAQCP